MATGPRVTHHILSVLVENRAGILSRVAGLFSRRGFNISSLAVSPTDDERFSRMTIVVDAESAPIEQVMRQLDKLINVVDITELSAGEAVERELMLATVAADVASRGQVTELAAIFEAKILDVGTDALTVMCAGTPDQLDAMEELLRPFGITDLQRTGRIALPRIPRGTVRLAAVPEIA
ncbi:MAG TPA: acetolactate synthase small subunit [Acidimicrobiia bacterium]|nr:acetolactate synthase small subunit [Acidimicrobiia bacterium]